MKLRRDPGAEVGLVEVRTQVARQLMSDEYGNYEAADLTPGVYRLSIELAGFRSVQQITRNLLARASIRPDKA